MVTKQPYETLCLGGLLCIELEQVRDDLLLVTVEVDAIGRLDSSIECAVGCAEVCGHEVGIVEVCKRLPGVSVASVKHLLSAILDGCYLFR